MSKDVAVIIPAFNCYDTIQRTLHSVAMQSLIDFTCYMIVDGEKEGSYDYLREQFKDLDLIIHYLEHNSGPAVARQYGIDHSTEPFVSFIDSDDTYLSSLSLYYQHKHFEDNIALVSSNFLEEKRDHDLYLREKDMVWMHGKMYRRSFLNKYDIRFNDSRANEDVGFNTQCQCYANEHEQVYLAQDVTYMWQWRDNSTVRTNNASYAYNESVEGYVENKIYAFKKSHKQKGAKNEDIRFFILAGMSHLFRKYLLAMLKEHQNKQSTSKNGQRNTIKRYTNK